MYAPIRMAITLTFSPHTIFGMEISQRSVAIRQLWPTLRVDGCYM